VRHCGYYLTAEEAALAYDKQSLLLWGENAFLNFPERKENV
jgi:hypothetical protein